MTEFSGLSCPTPPMKHSNIQMSHGSGGRLYQALIKDIFSTAFGTPFGRALHDSTVFESLTKKISVTTDSYVISPLFFPGGNIGELAVIGTVNDLLMSGATPKYLTASFILEEGFAVETLRTIVQKMADTAKTLDLSIIAGDTKVVERQKGDGVYINTTGIGFIEHSQTLAPESICPGDVILLSGDLGRHAISILAIRKGLEFETSLESDASPLNRMVLPLLAEKQEIHCLRDLTRGGLAAALTELSEACQMEMEIEEEKIPICDPVRGACELFGLDALHLANEGRMIAIVPERSAETILKFWKTLPQGASCSQIGVVREKTPPRVLLKSPMGTYRRLILPLGDSLPRIC